jgi:glycerol-3-phosphate acyltransferase PlsX
MSQDKRVCIALDAMGGDYAPAEIVKGAVLAGQNGDVEIVLVGQVDTIEEELAKHGSLGLPIRLVEATEVIREGEPAASAVRRKPNSSIVVATKMVKSGEADAMVSAGPSGAVAVSAVQHLGMLEGMERPALGGGFGSFAPGVLLMDLGANVDCKPYQLMAFAIAGSVYATQFLGVPNPTVGLLSTGAEEGKGNELVREGYYLLKDSGVNFVGNIEGSDILTGKANVVVCDGFVGNVLLKFYESIGEYALGWMRHKLKRHPLLSWVAKLVFDKALPMAKLSYEGEEAGSGILWGVNGIVRVAHGACQASHVAHGIAGAKKAVMADIIGALKPELERFKREGKL